MAFESAGIHSLMQSGSSGPDWKTHQSSITDLATGLPFCLC